MKCAICGKEGNVFKYEIGVNTVAYFHKECFKQQLEGKPIKYNGEVIGKVVSVE
jgi:hypothetical protein